MKKLFCAISALVLFVAPAWADDEDDEDQGFDYRQTIAIDVDHIENKSEQPKLNFKCIADQLYVDLTGAGLWNVADIKNPDSVKQSDLIIKLTVSAYDFGAMTNNDPIFHTNVTRMVAKLGMIFRVVDRNNRVLKVKKIEVSSSGKCSLPKFEGQIFQDVCNKASNSILSALVENMPFYILDVDGDEVSIAMGKTLVRKDQKLRVMMLRKSRRDPCRGGNIALEKEVARLQVVSADDKVCRAKIISGKDKLPSGNDEDELMKYRVHFLDSNEDDQKPIHPPSLPTELPF